MIKNISLSKLKQLRLILNISCVSLLLCSNSASLARFVGKTKLVRKGKHYLVNWILWIWMHVFVIVTQLRMICSPIVLSCSIQSSSSAQILFVFAEYIDWMSKCISYEIRLLPSLDSSYFTNDAFNDRDYNYRKIWAFQVTTQVFVLYSNFKLNVNEPFISTLLNYRSRNLND